MSFSVYNNNVTYILCCKNLLLYGKKKSKRGKRVFFAYKKFKNNIFLFYLGYVTCVLDVLHFVDEFLVYIAIVIFYMILYLGFFFGRIKVLGKLRLCVQVSLLKRFSFTAHSIYG